MVTSLKYDQLVEGFREKIHGNLLSTKLTQEQCDKEISAIVGGAVSDFDNEPVYIEPVPIITPTGPELDIIAATVLSPQKKRRGRPKGSRNKSKVK